MNNANDKTTTIGVDNEVIDVEEYGRANRKPPEAKRYRIRIDKKHYEVDVPEMTGRQLLELAGKVPAENYQIFEKLHGGQARQVELDKSASFRAPGVERFMTIPLDQTEG